MKTRQQQVVSSILTGGFEQGVQSPTDRGKRFGVQRMSVAHVYRTDVRYAQAVALLRRDPAVSSRDKQMICSVLLPTPKGVGFSEHKQERSSCGAA
ncbi:MAG: hypothetical protein HYW25_05870 [Candidatus Aenigmarchaeota archaeon]|nr:hypothetical protein [Candidatus Aenigmarchaeota archaeon]